MTEKMKAALKDIEALLHAMETCHVCKGTLYLAEIEPAHCEDCSWDCDDHPEPECTPLWTLHAKAKLAVKAFMEG